MSRLRGPGSGHCGSRWDGTCDQNEPDESEDGLVFVLPRAHRPAFFDASGLAKGIVITSDAAVLNGNPIPPGGVVSLRSPALPDDCPRALCRELVRIH